VSVAAPEPVHDPDDPRLRDFVALRDTNLRASVEAEHGFFLAEGATTIRRALAAGYVPRALLGSPDRLAALADVEAPAYAADAEMLRSLTGFDIHRGALASFERRPLPARQR